MKNIIKIASFNIKNTNESNNDRIDNISNIINKFDVIGTQELTLKITEQLKNKLNDNYSFYGKYRYGNLLKKLRYNENNNIITNQNVIYTKTYRLPSIPKNNKELKRLIKEKIITPRIATVIVIELENNKKICIINTHLNHKLQTLKEKQLDKLKSIIEKYIKYDIILTGDFNTDKNEKLIIDFSNELKEKYNINKINIDGITWSNNKGKERQLDHIFISNNLKVKESGIINTDNLSDHNLIYTEVEI